MLKIIFTMTLALVFSLQSVMAQCWEVVASKGNHTLAIKSDHSLWGWGRNREHQIGDGTTNNRLFPVRIGTGADWKFVATGTLHSLAIKENGTLWVWGSNEFNQLPPGGGSIPSQVGTDTNWKMVTAGVSLNAGIKTDGTMWTWGGANDYGQMGNGTTVRVPFPTQVGVESDWKEVSAGAQHVVAIKTDGSLWSWGRNDEGSLGDGTDISRYSPIRIGTENNWRSVSAGYLYTLALKTDGTLWSWGWNSTGQLGRVTGFDRFYPVQIGTDNDWESVRADSHSMALKTDGSLWVWAKNSYGQVGNGTLTNVSTPMQINTGVSRTIYITSGFDNSLIIAEDNSLKAWGRNDEGQLGDGTLIDKALPVTTSQGCVLNTQENMQNTLTLYPNPVSTLLNIQQNIYIEHVEVYDIGGKLLLKSVNDKNNMLDVSALENGVYLLKTVSGSNVLYQKFIKKN